MKKCYCCGAKIDLDTAAFCPKCGKPLEVTAELTRRAAAGDSDAQTELYYRTYAAVYARIRSKVPDDDTAMDLMQDTYLRAFSHLEQLNEPAAFPGWILTIARNLTINWYKKHSKEKTTALFSESEFENEANLSAEDDESASTEYRIDFMPEESLDRAETARLVSEILDELPEEQRVVLLMRFSDEMSIEEIAEELGVSPNTVKTRLLRAKKKVEAKVLELERKGTKLYSLAPLPFLLFLLGNLESQAPNISATQVLGAGTAGASAVATAGTTATTTAATSTGTTAATTAAATAGGVATKGLAVKIIAALLAVALVGGGGAAAYHAYTQAKEEEAAAIAAAEAEAEEAAALAEAERQAEEEAQRLAEEAEAQRQAEEEAEAQRQAEEEAEAALAAEKQQVEDAMLKILNSLSYGSLQFTYKDYDGNLTSSKVINAIAQQMYHVDGPFSTERICVDQATDRFVTCQVFPRDMFETYLRNIFGNLYSLSELDTSRYSDNADIYTGDDPDVLYYPVSSYTNIPTEIDFTILDISGISEDGIYAITVKARYEFEDTHTHYFIFYIAENDISDYGYAIVTVEQIALPDKESILSMLDEFNFIATAGYLDQFNDESISADEAILLAALALFEQDYSWTYDTYYFINGEFSSSYSSNATQYWQIPSELHEEYLNKLFSSLFTLSDFTGSSDVSYLKQDSNGNLYLQAVGYLDGDSGGTVADISISETPDANGRYTVVAQYHVTSADDGSWEEYMEYQVVADDTAAYGWAIVSMKEATQEDMTSLAGTDSD